MKIDDYNDLIGKYINKVDYDEDYIYFKTNDNITIRIPKLEPYCACYVGEYINEITQDGTCCGIITNIETNVKGNQENWFDEDKEIVYKGNVTFYFANGKINMEVEGLDNGYYGVCFTMPVEII